MACVSIIRRSALVGTTAIAAPGLGVAIVLLAYYPAERGTSPRGTSDPSLIALSERVLYDAPLVGTGAGTFTAFDPASRN
jgi:hypothetical protein